MKNFNPRTAKNRPVKTATGLNLERFPNFHKTGSIKGMKALYYGKGSLLIKQGDYIYNVSSEPEIYFNL